MKHLLLSSLQWGQLMRSARKRMGLNQHELGARVGLSQARISKMEREPQSITLDQLLALLGTLGLELTVQERPDNTAADPAAPQASGSEVAW
jgi:HTH-type transcriptional regulator/antitoxin HipB